MVFTMHASLLLPMHPPLTCAAVLNQHVAWCSPCCASKTPAAQPGLSAHAAQQASLVAAGAELREPALLP
jgi:hypothetical protein